MGIQHFCLFDSILYIPEWQATILESCPTLSVRVFKGLASTKQWIKCLAQGQNTVTRPAESLELATLRSGL